MGQGGMTKCWMLLLTAGFCPLAGAVPVRVRPVAASAAAVPGFPLEAVVAFPVMAGKGWRAGGDALTREHFAVFVPEAPVSAGQLLMELEFPGPEPGDYFGKFGVDVTTDAAPALDGRWMPLILETTSASDPDFAVAATPSVVLDRRHTPLVLTLRARVPFDGITGFRLRIFPESHEGGIPRLGRGPEGGFLLGGFRVEADVPRSTNLALGRQVYCSRQVQSGLPSRNLTDGFHATWSQPERQEGVAEGFFQMDLGQTTALDHVVVRRRQGPGAVPPPEGYAVELLTESSGAGWRARRSADQARPAMEVLRAGDGTGEFSGRMLMIRVEGGAGDQPQLAEIEVYPALRAEARQWLADGRVLEAAGPVQIPSGTTQLSFVPMGTGSTDGVTGCRWRLEGWQDSWQEAVMGRTIHFTALPGPGSYQVVVEARHSDGLWDATGRPVGMVVAAPWWSHAPSVVAAISGSLATAGAGAWFLMARRLRGRLAHTEQHLELHRDRLRISRDMHDEIGARLTSIAMLADRTRHQPGETPALLDDLAHQARSTVEALDTIVWAVNPRHDTVGGLADYLCDYAPVFLATAGMACQLDFQVVRPARPLALAVRHHLLMAAKEALQNVVKHSGARHCAVTLNEAAEGLELTVTDDGHGLGPVPSGGVSHTGLEAMRQRMAEAGGTCEISPGAQGCGVRVRLKVPLTLS
jgi:signal transduction histidine kinase